MTTMKDQLVEIAKKKIGEGADLNSLIDFLVREKVITTRRMRRAVVRYEFFERLLDPATQRTACDIEQDLSVEYGVSVRSVQVFRSEHRKSK